ncbi:MAG: Holliday junction resolvase RuvX [Pseudomonadota bacterium]|jgi:putative Holliday junction resolvase
MPEAGTVLAFDFGTRWIGVAVGDRALGSAHPLERIDATRHEASAAAIARLVEQWQPVELVVGVPRPDLGRDDPLTRSARAFGRALGRRHGLPVVEIDERYTSVDAASRLRDAGAGIAQRRTRNDPHAACVILEDYHAQRAAAGRAA